MIRLILLNKQVEPFPGQTLGISFSKQDLTNLKDELNRMRPSIGALAELWEVLKQQS